MYMGHIKSYVKGMPIIFSPSSKPFKEYIPCGVLLFSYFAASALNSMSKSGGEYESKGLGLKSNAFHHPYHIYSNLSSSTNLHCKES